MPSLHWHMFPGQLLFLFILETPYCKHPQLSDYRTILNLLAWQAGSSRELVHPQTIMNGTWNMNTPVLYSTATTLRYVLD